MFDEDAVAVLQPDGVVRAAEAQPVDERAAAEQRATRVRGVVERGAGQLLLAVHLPGFAADHRRHFVHVLGVRADGMERLVDPYFGAAERVGLAGRAHDARVQHDHVGVVDLAQLERERVLIAAYDLDAVLDRTHALVLRLQPCDERDAH